MTPDKRSLPADPINRFCVFSNTPRPALEMYSRRLQSSVRLHDDVGLCGSSLGVFENTVTRGIVSAVRRATGVVYVQTDAAINPGKQQRPAGGC